MVSRRNITARPKRVIASAQMRDDRADKEQDKADCSRYPDQWHADADQ
jgi:hypothetical protein